MAVSNGGLELLPLQTDAWHGARLFRNALTAVYALWTWLYDECACGL